MRELEYYHVDVFSDTKFSGNGLTVFTNASDLSAGEMLMITREMRQFESIFLSITGEDSITARVFTEEEELDFAGHPILGASAVLHWTDAPGLPTKQWSFKLNKSVVVTETTRSRETIMAVMNQGEPEFGLSLNEAATGKLLAALNLQITDLYPGQRPQMVSTGLPYLLVPLGSNLPKAKILVDNLETLLSAAGAKFIGMLDVPSLTIRTWNNSGSLEDVATGSLAGPAAAWLVSHGFHVPNQQLVINQGEHLGRPSKLFVELSEVGNRPTNVLVGGNVVFVGKGMIQL